MLEQHDVRSWQYSFNMRGRTCGHGPWPPWYQMPTECALGKKTLRPTASICRLAGRPLHWTILDTTCQIDLAFQGH